MEQSERAIGVFDSGLGGISVLKELQKHMPNEHYIYYGDSAFAPYGEKSKEAITARCIQICDLLLEQHVKAIVIACNTATSACVNELRNRYPNLIIVGMEPALKVVAQGRHDQHIVVMATHFTLKEKKFQDLMNCYAETNTIIELACPQLVQIIEEDRLDDRACVDAQLKSYFTPYDLTQIDSIVLGCTHFVFFKDRLQHIVGSNINIVDGNFGTVKHLIQLLEEQDMLRMSQQQGTLTIHNSYQDQTKLELSKKLISLHVLESHVAK